MLNHHTLYICTFHYQFQKLVMSIFSFALQLSIVVGSADVTAPIM